MRSIIKKWQQRARDLKHETYALFLAYKDPRTPWYAKVFTGLVVAYAFSPIDLIPDFIPVLGYLDDLLLVPMGISVAIKMIPTNVLAEARTRAQLELDQSQPVSWIAAVIIGLIWLSVLIFFIRWLWGMVAEPS